jgi:soluble epoxide hydrolase/lipid-phosphate phosphatase
MLTVTQYPSSSYLWHYQVKQCQDEGYGAIVPDLLGYGDTDHPSNIEAYNTTIIAKHVIDIVDYEGLDTVIGIAHDWYGPFQERQIYD